MLKTDENDETVAGKASGNENLARQERLQHDLFVLKKLNASFALYNEALKETQSRTEEVAVQLDRTDRLLDQYINLLQHTEKNSKLIFDETWKGGATDQVLLEKLRVEAIRKAEREQEERERAVHLEQERLEREEYERKMKEERDEKEKAKRGHVPVRGVRGVRGLRTRGTERGASNTTRGRVPSSSLTSAKRQVSEVSPRGNIVPRGGRKS